MTKIYKLEFNIKQHTPIIHFQHNQQGATLRASEVKPKLDRFIVKNAFQNDFSHSKKYLVGFNPEHPNNLREKFENGYRALDYKLRINDLDDSPEKGEVNIMPGTTENWTFSKSNIFFKIQFKNSLKVNGKTLGEQIEDFIELFFITHNFGKRQSKGFGSFYPENMTESNYRTLLLNNNYTFYQSNTSIKKTPTIGTYFYDQIIFKKWSELKSGVNMFWTNPAVYKKSAVFEYLANKNTRWDKRWIKKKLKGLIDSGSLPSMLKSRDIEPIDIDGKNHWEDYTNEEYRYGRALLGLAEHYEYATADKSLKYQVKVCHNIERFQSPVLFKVFDQSIYAIAQTIAPEMFDTPFQFEVQKKRNNKTEGDKISINGSLRTPSSGSFDLVEFLDNHFNSIGFLKITKP